MLNSGSGSLRRERTQRQRHSRSGMWSVSCLKKVCRMYRMQVEWWSRVFVHDRPFPRWFKGVNTQFTNIMDNLENGPCQVAPDGRTTLYNPYRSDPPFNIKMNWPSNLSYSWNSLSNGKHRQDMMNMMNMNVLVQNYHSNLYRPAHWSWIFLWHWHCQ